VIKNWGIVKVATTKAQRKLFFNLRKSKKNIGWLSNDEAISIAADLNVDVSDVYEMEKRLGNQDMSFDMPVDDSSEESSSYPSNYLHQYGTDPSILLEKSDWEGHGQDLLSVAMAELDERSFDIISSRWLTEKKSTLHELADRYNVSAERIRQLEQNAMKKIRTSVVMEA
jgi:RNA polymerase sigma-32 factor